MKCWNSAFNAQRLESNYSICTGMSSENICSNTGGAQAKGKRGWNSVYYSGWKTSLDNSYFVL